MCVCVCVCVCVYTYKKQGQIFVQFATPPVTGVTAKMTMDRLNYVGEMSNAQLCRRYTAG